MKNLEIIQNENSKQAVLCSQLFRGLELDASNYGYWIKKNIINNPFAIEGEDYILLSSPKGELRNKRNALSIKNYEISNILKSEFDIKPNTRTRNKQKGIDFVLTLDFAKRLAMMCRTEQGEKVRRYFLECEKIAINQDNSVIEALKQRISFYERIEQIKQIRIQLNKEIKQLRQFIETPPQIIQPVLKQLTLNFPEYEN
ncbi:hypothetical protein AX766_03935 [Flavobacterium covae]|uniref:antA/AntB antirepressor family protein n=1 Tax=Flavobacterium covae TaxID=2906076 RepID=UPI0007C1840F|nr:antA/AntB antirepressor family protein [Flavobacterium covae]AND63615.1 hypothetical protein AX766_03935 [Flavobacterium covae]